jgi:hypothetical protein
MGARFSHARSFAVICGIASTDVIVASEIYRRACAANLAQMFALRPG